MSTWRETSVVKASSDLREAYSRANSRSSIAILPTNVCRSTKRDNVIQKLRRSLSERALKALWLFFCKSTPKPIGGVSPNFLPFISGKIKISFSSTTALVVSSPNARQSLADRLGLLSPIRSHNRRDRPPGSLTLVDLESASLS
jgi:hypothetical protein